MSLPYLEIEMRFAKVLKLDYLTVILILRGVGRETLSAANSCPSWELHQVQVTMKSYSLLLSSVRLRNDT